MSLRFRLDQMIDYSQAYNVRLKKINKTSFVSISFLNHDFIVYSKANHESILIALMKIVYM